MHLLSWHSDCTLYYKIVYGGNYEGQLASIVSISLLTLDLCIKYVLLIYENLSQIPLLILNLFFIQYKKIWRVISSVMFCYRLEKRTIKCYEIKDYVRVNSSRSSELSTRDTQTFLFVFRHVLEHGAKLMRLNVNEAWSRLLWDVNKILIR